MGYRVLYLAIQGRIWGRDGNGAERMGIKGEWGKRKKNGKICEVRRGDAILIIDVKTFK